MKVVVAETAGFCMGVSRAVGIAESEAQKSAGNVFTLGELIHNRQVVQELAEQGITVAEELPESGTVIIRAHGVEPGIKEELLESGVRVVDATCPHVVSSQRRIAEYSAAGGTVVISGDKDHPEVAGLCGYAQARVKVVDSLHILRRLNLPLGFLFISQTTFSKKLFAEMAAFIQVNYPAATIVNSICNATELRQQEAEKLAAVSQLLVVVGGKHSANTLRLVEIGLQQECRVIHVETAEELEGYDFSGSDNIGVTAGASTPESSIVGVVDYLNNI